MRRFVFRVLTMATVLMLTAGTTAFSAGRGEAVGEDPVELKMYLIGEPHRDTDVVLAELNGHMERDIGARLKVTYLPWGDWRTRYPLLFASGEKFDLIYTSDWAFYFREARNGAFWDLTDEVKSLTPDLYASIPEEAWKQTLVEGRSYMVPSNNPEYDGYGFMYRKDLAVKYGLSPEINDLETLEAYLAAVKANEPGMLPYNAGTWDLRLIELMYAGLKREVLIPLIDEDWNIFIPLNDLDGPVVVDELEPDFLPFLKTMRAWQQKGFWSKNVMANQIGSRDAFENGTSAIALCNTVNNNNLYQNTAERHPDWDFGFFDFYGKKDARMIFPYIANGMGINRNSAHPEKALALLEKLHRDDRYYRLTQYGREKVHYVIDSEGMIGFPEGFDPAESWSFTSWGWNEVSREIPSRNDWPHWLALQKAYAAKQKVNPIGDFSFDEGAVENEMAAVSSVMSQYKTPLYWGLADPVEGLEELRSKLKTAGYDKIVAEAERQYRAYRNR